MNICNELPPIAELPTHELLMPWQRNIKTKQPFHAGSLSWWLTVIIMLFERIKSRLRHFVCYLFIFFRNYNACLILAKPWEKVISQIVMIYKNMKNNGEEEKEMGSLNLLEKEKWKTVWKTTQNITQFMTLPTANNQNHFAHYFWCWKHIHYILIQLPSFLVARFGLCYIYTQPRDELLCLCSF